MNVRRLMATLGRMATCVTCATCAGCVAGGGTDNLASDETMGLIEASVTHEPFGTLPAGGAIELFTLRNANGLEVRAMEYGAIIVAIRTPDRAGVYDEITLGFDDLGGYLGETPYFGAVVGRYGNRIAGGRFSLDGQDYELARNNGPNHLHGGIQGFDKVVWSGTPVQEAGAVGVRFSYTSVAGEEGYPGTLRTAVTYLLNDADELAIVYSATADAATPVNLTQHAYFNLAGGGDVLGHELQLNASAYTPVDESLIPTGQIAPVSGTPFDFRNPTPIGARIAAPDAQLGYGGGYDHNFVLDPGAATPGIVLPMPAEGLVLAARVVEPGSGRRLDVFTSEPGIQLYSGNFLDGSLVGKDGVRYHHRSGFCLETQHFPDSPNQPTFPSTILRPGQEYATRTVWRFSTTG